VIRAIKNIGIVFDGYLFEKGRGETLALLRTVFGLLAFCMTFVMFLRFSEWFGTDGLLNSNCENLSIQPIFSILNGVRSETQLFYVVVLTLIFSLTMMVGFYARVSTIATFVLLTSLQTRTLPILCGGDRVIQLMLFYLCFADVGACWSVDYWRSGAERLPGKIVNLWPQKLIVIQCSLMYFSAVLYKLMDDCWLNGTVLYYALHYKDFVNFPLPEWFRNPPFTDLFSYFSLVTEMFLAFLPFLKAQRKWILLAGVGLHTGIMYTLFIPNFGIVTMASYLAYFSGDEIAGAFKDVCRKFQTWVPGLRVYLRSSASE
jgi:hypothetical protein